MWPANCSEWGGLHLSSSHSLELGCCMEVGAGRGSSRLGLWDGGGFQGQIGLLPVLLTSLPYTWVADIHLRWRQKYRTRGVRGMVAGRGGSRLDIWEQNGGHRKASRYPICSPDWHDLHLNSTTLTEDPNVVPSIQGRQLTTA